MESSPPDLKTYRGNCHCGAFVFEIQCPEITSAMTCSCSICSKKAYDWIFSVTHGGYKVIKGSEDDLVAYTFGPKKLEHLFCPTCGSAVLGRQATIEEGKLGRAFNARAIQGILSWDLDKDTYDGAAISGPYDAPKYAGPEPEMEVEGGKLYTGSCHCGAVTLALRSKPLEEQDATCECNCSICSRNGYLWTYPDQQQLVIQGNDNLTRYGFGPCHLDKTFCKTCGIHITNDWRDLSEEAQAAMNDGKRHFYQNFRHFRPLNVRTLNNFDMTTAQPKRQLEGDTMGGEYVNP